MKELRTGLIDSHELCSWFNIGYGSFKNAKEKKLEELALYCKFELYHGGVNVLEILDKNNVVYNRQIGKKYKKVRYHMNDLWGYSGTDTCKRVSDTIDDLYGKELGLSLSTIYTYTCKARAELYGTPFISFGTLGTCERKWSKKIYLDDGNYDFVDFTPEEDKIKKDLLRAYFSTDEEKEVQLAMMVDEGEVTEAEAYRILRKWKNLTSSGFREFMKLLQDKLGCEVVRTTTIPSKENRKSIPME